MFKYVTGDLVKDAEKYDVIVHGCNCFHTMNSGIAPQIRKKFPEAYFVDCSTSYGNTEKLGTISYTLHTTPIVVNAYTQFNYSKHKINIDYDAVEKCMENIKLNFSGKKIALPQIGAGLAGGDWNIIEKIIKSKLIDENVTIVLWNRNKTIEVSNELLSKGVYIPRGDNAY